MAIPEEAPWPAMPVLATDPLMLTVYDKAHSGEEDRWHTMGRDATARLLTISHTLREMESGRTRVRIISAREVTRDERKTFENEPK